MTAAPIRALARRPLPSLAALVLVAALGCGKGGADGRASAGSGSSGGSGGGTASSGATMDAAGEVVIDAPSGAYAVAAVPSPGAVTGRVLLDGTPTPEPPTPTGSDGPVCGASIADSSVQGSGGGLANAVVWLDGVRKGKALPAEKRIELESDHCLLVPRVQAAVTGGAVNVIGHDPFRQHLRFMAAGEKEPRAIVLLGKDEQVIPTEKPLASPALVVVRDADHPWPHAWIAVFDHPYFAVTKPDGSFSIDGVPPGDYTLHAWHERTARSDDKVTIAPNGTARLDVKLAVK